MSMNIKSQEAHRLAQDLAEITGETLTAAVTTALRERLERLRRKHPRSLTERLGEIGKSCAEHMKKPFLSVEHGDLLYGDDGLPR